ncbi:MAG: metallophosphoesterase [Candidatus Nealsonbacteria bacterium]|nr:metallophosphoesterase [Candidatus Nealsonbacteria bacterium]
MKLHVLADIHLEFAPFDVPDTDADVVVFAGDVGTRLGGIEWANRLEKQVVYVAGNHEYYGSALPELTEEMRAAAGPNVALLENDELIVGDVRFLGATLWTDFLLFGDASKDDCMDVAGKRMNDFRMIRCSPQGNRLSPPDTAVLHGQTRQWLRTALQRDHAGPTVVVTHHAPSIHSAEPQYLNDPLAAAFGSDVEELIDGDRVALWIHGHTHNCVDYELAGTRVVSNQRGYPRESTAFDPALVIDVPT